jgi:hypothetical protein
MSKRRAAIAWLVLLGFMSAQLNAETLSPETRVKLNAVLANWKSIQPDTLQRPENADLLEALKARAKDRRQTAARVALIRLGDEDVIRSCLEEYRMDQPSHRASAMTQLGIAGNPKVIALLADDLNLNESANLIFFEDNGMLPRSMAAASIIKAIIINSPSFSQEVKAWAVRLPTVTVGLRDGVRSWLAINNAALERGDYPSVIPLTIKRGEGSRPAPTTRKTASLIRTPTVILPLASTPSAVTSRAMSVWPWVAGICLLIAIVVLVWRRRT